MSAVCIILTGFIALLTVLTVILQIQALCRANRWTSHNKVIVRNWCALGLLGLIAIASIAELFVSVPFLDLAWIVVALAGYSTIFWGPAMRHVVERTEGLNFARARGISNESKKFWTAIGSHERERPQRVHHA